MAWRSGSLSRSLMSTARASLRPTSPSPSSSSLPRLRPPPTAAPRVQSRRFSMAPSRNLGKLGCLQSLLPLHNMMAASCMTSRFAVSARAFCELSNGDPDS